MLLATATATDAAGHGRASQAAAGAAGLDVERVGVGGHGREGERQSEAVSVGQSVCGLLAAGGGRQRVGQRGVDGGVRGVRGDGGVRGVRGVGGVDKGGFGLGLGLALRADGGGDVLPEARGIAAAAARYCCWCGSVCWGVGVGVAVAVGVGLGLALLELLLLVLALQQLLLLGVPGRDEFDAGEGLGEDGVNLVVVVGWGSEGVGDTRTGGAGGKAGAGSRGHAVSAGRVVLLLALVLLVAQDSLMSDLEPPAGPLPVAVGGFFRGPHPVMDVPVSSA